MASYPAMEYFEPYVWHDGLRLGWFFWCPKCRTQWLIPTTLIEKYNATGELKNYPPSAHRLLWQEEGTLETLTLNPSIVCRTQGCTGHYWVRDGAIIDV